MKAQRIPITRIKLAKGLYVPHREPRNAETDVVPIYKQCFPLHRTMPPRLVETRNFVVAADDVPIYREVFPVSRTFVHGQSSAAGVVAEQGPLEDDDATLIRASMELRMEEISDESLGDCIHKNKNHGSCGCTLSSTSQRFPQRDERLETPSLSHHHSDNDRQAATIIRSNPEPSSRTVCSPRYEKKIRDLDYVMGWFVSEGREPIAQPFPCNAKEEDLFIRICSANLRIQVWLKGSLGWETIAPGHKHPTLSGYGLVLTDGKPSWVTTQTIATYNY